MPHHKKLMRKLDLYCIKSSDETLESNEGIDEDYSESDDDQDANEESLNQDQDQEKAETRHLRKFAWFYKDANL